LTALHIIQQKMQALHIFQAILAYYPTTCTETACDLRFSSV